MEFIINTVKKLWESRFIRFLFIGGLNTLFGYGVFSLMIYLGLHYTLSALLSTIAGIIFNFHTVGSIVFNDRRYSLLARFILVYFIGYGLNVFGIHFLMKYFNNEYISAAILVMPLAVIMFSLHRKFVFRKRINPC